MKKLKIGLRLHIFLAFLLVFVLSFGLIILSFNLVLQNYINSDATTKIRDAIVTASSLAEKRNLEKDIFMPVNESAADLLVRQLVRPLTSTSEVYAALISESYAIEYPKYTDSIKERSMVQDIVRQLKRLQISSGKSVVHIMKTENNSTYYVSLVEVKITYPDPNDDSTPLYLLLYFDATPFLLFAERVNAFLIIVLLTALLLTLITSLIVSNSIIRSVKKLTLFAVRIGSGMYQRENFQFFDRELDTLAINMNTMAEKIEQADQDQKTFFQNASHELRTPLMSIQGYAEGIKYDVFDDKENASDIIISEAQRLTQMVENLLTISRLDTAAAGRNQIPKSIVDLRELMESVVENMRGSAFIAKKSILFDLPSSPVYLLANENDLSRAFENIIANGIRYCSSTVTVAFKRNGSDQVIVEISDDGPGIPESLLPFIFDRFSKGDGGKHGIGLALVRAIVKEHSGNVTAGNLPDQKGAVFAITLPTVREILPKRQNTSD